MKTDKELAQDILCKLKCVKNERRLMKNRMCRVTAFSCAFALIFVAVFSLFIGGTPIADEKTPTLIENVSSKKSFLMVANAIDETETSINKGTDVSLPLGGMLMVEETKGMSNSEIDEVMLNLKDKLTTLYGKDKGWQLRGEQGDTTIYFGTADYLKLKVEEVDSVEKITISCTENGKITFSDKTSLSKHIETLKQGRTVTVTGKEYKEIYSKEADVHIEWFLSEKLIDVFKKAPDTSLSVVSDEITVKINYIDGSEESYVIYLSFDDEGLLTAKCSF